MEQVWNAQATYSRLCVVLPSTKALAGVGLTKCQGRLSLVPKDTTPCVSSLQPASHCGRGLYCVPCTSNERLSWLHTGLLAKIYFLLAFHQMGLGVKTALVTQRNKCQWFRKLQWGQEKTVKKKGKSGKLKKKKAVTVDTGHPWLWCEGHRKRARLELPSNTDT